jgi:hypothetical protein
MSDTWVQIVFGWPAILASLAACVAGVVWGRPWLLLVGAILFLPFSFYLGGAPRTMWYPVLLPICMAFAGWAVFAGKVRLAWLLLSPAFLISGWLAVLVLTQNK